MTLNEELWAETVRIGRLHGDGAVEWMMDRICDLAEQGNVPGVKRFMEITLRLYGLLDDSAPH